MAAKACITCGEIKPLSKFYNDSYSPDGTRSTCKACQKVSDMELSKKLREQVAISRRILQKRFGVKRLPSCPCVPPDGWVCDTENTPCMLSDKLARIEEHDMSVWSGGEQYKTGMQWWPGDEFDVVETNDKSW